MKKYKVIFLILLLNLFSCGSSEHAAYIENQLDTNRIRNDARNSLTGFNEGFKDLSYYNKVNKTENDSQVQLGLTETDPICINSVAGYCSEYQATYKLNLSWSCEGETSHFIKTKIHKLSVKNSLLHLYDINMIKIGTMPVKFDSHYQTLNLVSKTVYNTLASIEFEYNDLKFKIPKNKFLSEIEIPSSICELNY